MSEIMFRRDTVLRKTLFDDSSFSHPAKMDAQLLIWIVDRYTKPGDTILDPMAGSGTTMLACMNSRNVILVELEEKFVKMCQDNWELVKMKPQLGHQMGGCEIIQGDARNLSGLLVDQIVTSPPFGERHSYSDTERERQAVEKLKSQSGSQIGGSRIHEHSGDNPNNIDRLSYGSVDSVITSPPHGGIDSEPHDAEHHGYGTSDGQLGNLSYGQVDSVVTSPPYAGSLESSSRHTQGGIADRDKKLAQTGTYADMSHQEKRRQRLVEQGHDPKDFLGGKARNTQLDWEYSPNDDNIGNLDYGGIDKIITSPPYEGSLTGRDNPKYESDEYKQKMAELPSGDYSTPGRLRSIKSHESGYSISENNIGNLKPETYLEAMFHVYKQCFSVLKPMGLMVLVTKNFIRDKKVVRLDEDTIKLCVAAGFSFIERHYRKLPSQSFWRILYQQKYPDVEKLTHEDVMVFSKSIAPDWF